VEEPGLPADVSGGAFLQAFHGSQAGYLQHFLFPFERENFNTFCKVNQQYKLHQSQNVVLSGQLRWWLTLNNSLICLGDPDSEKNPGFKTESGVCKSGSGLLNSGYVRHKIQG
jgi:hypothetical protein